MAIGGSSGGDRGEEEEEGSDDVSVVSIVSSVVAVASVWLPMLSVVVVFAEGFLVRFFFPGLIGVDDCGSTMGESEGASSCSDAVPSPCTDAICASCKGRRSFSAIR